MSLTIEAREGKLVARGDFTAAGAMAALAQGRQALVGFSRSEPRVVMNMAEVSYVGSVAVAIVLSWSRLLRERSQRLVIESPPESFVSALRLCGVESLVEVRSA